MAKLEPFNFRIILATRRPLLISIALALGGAMLVFLLLIPQGKEAYSLFTQVNDQKPKTTELKQKLASLENISTIAEYAQAKTVDDALPSKKPLLELLKSLSTVSLTSGAQIVKFELSPGLVASDAAQLQKIGSSVKNRNYDSMEVTLKIAGNFKQIQDFLIQVEKASPFTTVTEMEISGQVDKTSLTDSLTNFQAQIKTSTYFFTQPISVRVETPLPLLGEKERSVLSSLASFAPTDLENQTEVKGGGLEDLFGVKSFDSEKQVESLLQTKPGLVAPTPTPATNITPITTTPAN